MHRVRLRLYVPLYMFNRKFITSGVVFFKAYVHKLASVGSINLCILDEQIIMIKYAVNQNSLQHK